MKKLGWHTVSEIMQMETLSMVHKSINDLASTYLTEMFSRLSDTNKRELRNYRPDLAIPMRKSVNGQKCFSYKGATMWSRLSLESKLSPTLKTFKKAWQTLHQANSLTSHYTLSCPYQQYCIYTLLMVV